MIVRYLSPAKIEVKEAIAYYEKPRQGFGRRFRNELDRCIRRIVHDPTSYPLFEDEFNVRFITLRRFPYAVLFQCLSESEILIIAVAHGSRDEGYWRNRVSK